MISEIIEKWIKGILIDGITGNLSGLFDNVNAKVGEIASDVGSTPQAWNSGIFNMLRSLSETVVLPIAAAILALVMCHELIQMITEKNNMQNIFTRNLCGTIRRSRSPPAIPFPGCGRNSVSSNSTPKLHGRPDKPPHRVQPLPQKMVSG